MMSAPKRGTPGFVAELVTAAGSFSLLRRKRSSLPLPLVGTRQYVDMRLSSLFRLCGGVLQGWSIGGMFVAALGEMGDRLYWNGGDIGIRPTLLRRRWFAAAVDNRDGRGARGARGARG